MSSDPSGGGNAFGARSRARGVPSDDPAGVVNEFLRLYLDDLEQRKTRSLDEYVALFPGRADMIAHELAELVGEQDFAPTLEPPDPNPRAPGRQFGPYLLVRRLGRGGQGLVWLARDTRLDRFVALKILTEFASLSPAALERFRREAQLASRLDDPGICAVFETGSERGVPFIAMRHVEGETLAAYIERTRKNSPVERSPAHLVLPADPDDTPERERPVRLVERIARCLHKAHEAGIVHRDVKPGNVMVGMNGLPVLLDFGLAGVVDDSLPTFTRTGDLFGTPAYMAPEQLSASGQHADRRSDVWALGALLYECLTLRQPFASATLEATYRAIREVDPEDPRRLAPEVSRDLKTILDTALAKERDRRYLTALAFAEDLRRVLEGKPILAHPPSRMYMVERFIRRYRRLVLATLLVVTALAVSTSVAITSMLRAHAAEQRAETGAELEGKLRADAEAATAEALHERGLTEARELATRRVAYSAQMGLAFGAYERRYFSRVAELLEAQMPSVGADDLRGFEWFMLWGLCHDGLQASLLGHKGSIRALECDPDGNSFCSVDTHGWARRWNAHTLALESEWTLPIHPGLALALSPDARCLAALDTGDSLSVWETGTWRRLANFALASRGSTALALSSDGARLAWVGTNAKDDLNTIAVWDVRVGKEVFSIPHTRDAVRSLAFSPDASTIAVGGQDGSLLLLDGTDGSELTEFHGHRSAVLCVAFSPDGSLLASSAEWTIRLWDTRSYAEVGQLEGFSGSAAALAFSRDGRHLAASSVSDWTLRTWDLDTFQEASHPRLGGAQSLEYSSDGRRLLLGDEHGVLSVWSAGASLMPLVLELPFTFDHKQYEAGFRLTFAPDGRTLATSGGPGTVLVWSLAERRVIRTHAAGAHVTALAFAPDGGALAIGTAGGRVAIWNSERDEARSIATPHVGSVRGIAWSPDGKSLASCGADKRVARWDVDTLESLAAVPSGGVTSTAVCFSQDGRELAVAGLDRCIRFLNPRTLEERSKIMAEGEVFALAFSPDGATLATSQQGWTPKLWDSHSHELRATLSGHTGGSYEAVAFSADGRTVATGSIDKTVRLWQVSNGQELTTLQHPDHVHAVAFSPDGGWLATWSCDKKLRLWQAASREHVTRANGGR